MTFHSGGGTAGVGTWATYNSFIYINSVKYDWLVNSYPNGRNATYNPYGKLIFGAASGGARNLYIGLIYQFLSFRRNQTTGSTDDYRTSVIDLYNEGPPSTRLQVGGDVNVMGQLIMNGGQLLMNGRSMSKPPVVFSIKDYRSGCPPSWGAMVNFMSHTISLSRPEYVYASVTTILNYHTRADCYIYFGGQPMQNHLTASDNTSWNPVNITAGGYLPSGNWTIAFRCSVANVVGCGPDWGGMQILVFET